MEQDKRYYAFISYKREDERWAKWLQHRLEHYKLPSNLNGRTDLPREIRPVFRDTAELNPGNLPQQIHDALAASRHLIVVCSPRSAASPWVNREIEAFIAMGKQDRIIPFIVDGRPMADDPGEECFPQAIRDLPKEQELLGANVNEMGRDAAAVKTVAQMFGVRFDTLWKRYEREQKRKRAMVVAAVALFVLAVLTVAGVILRQNTVINKSRADLQEAYDNLSAANRKTEAERARAEHERDRAEQAEDSIRVQYSIIEQANDDLRRTNDARAQAQSRAAAEAAKRLSATDVLLARRVAAEALLYSYTAEAEETLRRSMKKSDFVLYNCDGRGVAFSPDGKTLAATAYQSVILFDVENGAILKRLNEHDDHVHQVTFSNDGKKILSVSDDSTVHIWNTSNGKCIGVLKDKQYIYSATFSPDGKHIATISAISPEDYFLLVNDRNWTSNRILVEDTNVLNGDTIYLSEIQEYDYEITIKTWDTDKMNPNISIDIPAKRNGHVYLNDNISLPIAYSPGGNQIVAPDDNGIVLIDASTGNIKKHINTRNTYTSIKDMSFARKEYSDGHNIVTAESNGIAEYNTDGAGIKFSPITDYSSTALSVNPSDSSYFVVGSSDGKVRVFDRTEGIISIIFSGHTDVINSVSFAHDGSKVASASADGTVRVWDVDPDKIKTRRNSTYVKIPYGYDGYSRRREVRVWENENLLTRTKEEAWSYGYDDYAVMSPDKKLMIIPIGIRNGLLSAKPGDNNSLLGVWDLALLTFSPDSKTIVCYDNKAGQVRLIEVYGKQRDKALLPGGIKHVDRASFSPDSKRIVLSDGDKNVCIYDANNGNVLHTLKGHSKKVEYACFSPDGKHVASSDESGMTCIWDATTGLCLNRIQTGKSSFLSLNLGGKKLATVSNDSIIALWTIQNSTTYTKTLLGIGYSAVFSPNGLYVVTTHNDKDVCVWNVEKEAIIQDFYSHTGRPLYAEFSNDGRQIFSSSDDYDIRIWDFPTIEELIATVRKQNSGKLLSSEEKKRFYLD